MRENIDPYHEVAVTPAPRDFFSKRVMHGNEFWRWENLKKTKQGWDAWGGSGFCF